MAKTTHKKQAVNTKFWPSQIYIAIYRPGPIEGDCVSPEGFNMLAEMFSVYNSLRNYGSLSTKLNQKITTLLFGKEAYLTHDCDITDLQQTSSRDLIVYIPATEGDYSSIYSQETNSGLLIPDKEIENRFHFRSDIKTAKELDEILEPVRTLLESIST